MSTTLSDAAARLAAAFPATPPALGTPNPRCTAAPRGASPCLPRTAQRFSTTTQLILRREPREGLFQVGTDGRHRWNPSTTGGVPMHLEAYLALGIPFAYLDEQFSPRLASSLDELISLSTALTIQCLNQSIPLSIESVSSTRLDRFVRRSLGMPVLRHSRLIRLDADVEVNDKMESDFISNGYEGNPDDIIRVVARRVFEKRAHEIMIAANLSNVGSLELVRMVSRCESSWKVYPETVGALEIREAVIASAKHQWPAMQRLGFGDVWAWLNRFSGFTTGFSNSQVGRALNAMTQIMNEKALDMPLQLVWSMIGLEAIYCRRTEAVLEQLRDGSSLLLGTCPIRKLFNTMYDSRSKFLHGTMNFAGSDLLEDARDDVGKFDQSMAEASALAIAVLVATIQELVVRGWTGVGFRYEVVPEVDK